MFIILLCRHVDMYDRATLKEIIAVCVPKCRIPFEKHKIKSISVSFSLRLILTVICTIGKYVDNDTHLTSFNDNPCRIGRIGPTSNFASRPKYRDQQQHNNNYVVHETRDDDRGQTMITELCWCITEWLQVESIARLRQLDLIGKNFILLHIQFDRKYPYVVVEQKAMTGDNLLSQLGGVLSLWLGITIMTAVELIELFYTIADQWIRRQRTTTVPSKMRNVWERSLPEDRAPEQGGLSAVHRNSPIIYWLIQTKNNAVIKYADHSQSVSMQDT